MKNDNNVRRTYDVTAEVHKPVKKGFRVKVSIMDLGMYINGMMVFPPNDEHTEWWVFTPSQRAGRGKSMYFVEFNKKLPLWAEVEDACIDAFKLEQSLDDEVDEPKRPFKYDLVIEDIDENEPINLDDIEL
jgi:hypothetical protein